MPENKGATASLPQLAVLTRFGGSKHMVTLSHATSTIHHLSLKQSWSQNITWTAKVPNTKMLDQLLKEWHSAVATEMCDKSTVSGGIIKAGFTKR